VFGRVMEKRLDPGVLGETEIAKVERRRVPPGIAVNDNDAGWSDALHRALQGSPADRFQNKREPLGGRRWRFDHLARPTPAKLRCSVSLGDCGDPGTGEGSKLDGETADNPGCAGDHDILVQQEA